MRPFVHQWRVLLSSLTFHAELYCVNCQRQWEQSPPNLDRYPRLNSSTVADDHIRKLRQLSLFVTNASCHNEPGTMYPVTMNQVQCILWHRTRYIVSCDDEHGTMYHVIMNQVQCILCRWTRYNVSCADEHGTMYPMTMNTVQCILWRWTRYNVSCDDEHGIVYPVPMNTA